MPIIEINALPNEAIKDRAQMLKDIGASVSESVGLPKERIIIYWRDIPSNQLLCRGEVAMVQADDSHHPIVFVSALEGKGDVFKENLCKSLVESLSDQLKVKKENIAIVYDSIKSGHLYVAGEFK